MPGNTASEPTPNFHVSECPATTAIRCPNQLSITAPNTTSDFQDDALNWTRQQIVAPGSCKVCDSNEGKSAPATVGTLHNTMSIIDPSLFEPPRDSDMPQQVFENEYRTILRPIAYATLWR
ncbi:uncharacterized protein L3040_003035 [Drepanopeziza brunnea f. sp. 'multigermtubi']|uniref:uncharacterized protein n=1 Tax=Drepanopeziza brunnea f. sp. 'multigermtubi' TaxID=698441 RepID=UPI00239224B9|nr:hypothetical protein L3040_003035 [Drepanopeziza brunnea f. sp. 'multigermtubi']